MNDNKDFEKIFKRSILPAELIDRAAIFTVNRLGFSVFICVKGNVHEYKRVSSEGILITY